MSYQRDNRRSSRYPLPVSDRDVDMSGSQRNQIQQRRLQASVPITGVPPLPRQSSNRQSSPRGRQNFPQQSAQHFSQLSVLYKQLAALTAQNEDLSSLNEEYQLEAVRLREERDLARREAADADREIQRLHRQLEDERRRNSTAQEPPAMSSSFNFTPQSSVTNSTHPSPSFFRPNDNTRLFSLAQSSTASSTSINPTMSSSMPTSTMLSRPITAPVRSGVNTLGTTLLSGLHFKRLPPVSPAPALHLTDQTHPTPPISTSNPSRSMPPPPLPLFSSVSNDELRTARRQENERNRTLNVRTKEWIKENERRRRAGEELEYNSWDDYRQAEIDDEDEYDDDDDIPYTPSSTKRRTESIGSSSTEHTSGALNTVTDLVIHRWSIPRDQEEANAFFTRANNGDASAQAALNNCVAEFNQLRRDGLPVPQGLDYAMGVFARMETPPTWRLIDAQQRQKRNPRSIKKRKAARKSTQKSTQRSAQASHQTSNRPRRPHPPGFSHLVPKDQTPPARMWRMDDTVMYWAEYILRNEDTFDHFYQRHPYLRYENGSVSLSDIRSLRVCMNLRPSDPLGLATLHLSRSRFQVVLAELLATPGEYAFIVQRDNIPAPLTWSPRPFNGPISNLDTAEVARFLASVGFSFRRADDAQFYWRRWISLMATEFPHDNIDYQGILLRTYRPDRHLPCPLPTEQLWHPSHPQGLDNLTPSSIDPSSMPFDTLPTSTYSPSSSLNCDRPIHFNV